MDRVQMAKRQVLILWAPGSHGRVLDGKRCGQICASEESSNSRGEGGYAREGRTFKEHLGVRANQAGVRGREEGVRVIPTGWEKRIRNWFCVFSRGG